MAVTVSMPQMGESVVEGTLERWLVGKGERVERDQNLCEITTDKIDAELPSPAAGVVTEILVAEGQTVEVGTSLIVIDERAAAAVESSEPTEAHEPSESPEAAVVEGPAAAAPAAQATPMARRRAGDLGVDLDRVSGSGVSGRVVKADVEAAARQSEASSPPSAAPASGTLGEFLWGLRVPTHRVREDDKVVPFTSVRRRIAEHMVVSKIVSPHVGAVARVDLQRVVALRESVKADFERAHGYGLTYLSFAVQATVRALREFPRMNATVVGQSIIEHAEIHIGVAVETERGLLVPVVRHADRLSLVGIAEAIQDLALRARSREIGADELAGGTFTLSNPGRRGNLYGFAVINQPQVGILRTGEVRKNAGRGRARGRGRDRDPPGHASGAVVRSPDHRRGDRQRFSVLDRRTARDRGFRALSPGAMGETLQIRRLGRVEYGRALALQESLRAARGRGEIPDTVLLLDHPDVITYGRSSRPGSVSYSDEELRASGYQVFRVNRGGDVTWHGPGQLVGYPILDLSVRARDVHRYLRRLEELLIAALGDLGVPARRRPGYTGVWLDGRRKLASIGVGVRRWLTLHGFALNVCCDLKRFEAIRPCGLPDVEMVSVESVLGRPVELDIAIERVEFHLRQAFAAAP